MLLLVLYALTTGAEAAFFSLTSNDYEALRQEKSNSAKRILRLKERPRVLLATTLVINSLFYVAVILLFELLLRKSSLGEWTDYWAFSLVNATNSGSFLDAANFGRALYFIIAIPVVSFFLVLFGEVAPKIYARFNHLRLARIASAPLMILTFIFRPITWLLVRSTVLIENRLSAKIPEQLYASREDFDEAIDLTVSKEKGAQQDVDMLKSIVKFGDVSVKQIMRSRTDVVAIDLVLPYSELLQLIKESGYSRLPVYENDFDNVKGILYVKDLIGHLSEKDDFQWQQLIRTNVLFVPESRKINDTLEDFQESRMHMAIVVDEYGGTSGILTLEDIMEEVIGEIRDEFDDEPEVHFKKIDDHNYLFEGKTMLNDLCKVLNIASDTFDASKGDADSLAGLILEMVGYIPKIDREIVFKAFKLKVVAASERRIEQVLVTIT